MNSADLLNGPILWFANRGSGFVLLLLLTDSTMLGVLSDRVYPMETLRLGPGDVALLITDGVYSARRADGERATLEDVAPVFSKSGSVFELLKRMRGGSAFDDDVTAFAMQHLDGADVSEN